MRTTTNRILIVILAVAIFAALAGCQNPAPGEDYPDYPEEMNGYEEDPGQEVRPPRVHTDFLWEITGGQGRVFLMGSMRVVADDYTLTPAIADIVGQMDALALEMDAMDADILPDLMALMLYPDGTTLADNLSESGLAHLTAMLEAYDLNEGAVLPIRPSSLPPTFLAVLAAQSDFTIMSVELLLNIMAWERGMPIYTLENIRTHLGNLNALPADVQERTLVLNILPPDEALAQLNYEYDIFLSGDEQRMTAFLAQARQQIEDADEGFAYYMHSARTRIMADAIISLLEGGQNIFATADLSRILGEGGIIQLLEEAGYQVVRVAPGDVDLTQMPAPPQIELYGDSPDYAAEDEDTAFIPDELPAPSAGDDGAIAPPY